MYESLFKINLKTKRYIFLFVGPYQRLGIGHNYDFFYPNIVLMCLQASLFASFFNLVLTKTPTLGSVGSLEALGDKRMD